MSLATAAENLHAAARHGIEAQRYWPGLGEAPAAELILRRLLPLAREGLGRWDVSQADADRLLGIVEQRCLTRLTGAAMQVAAGVPHASSDSDSLERIQTITHRLLYERR